MYIVEKLFFFYFLFWCSKTLQQWRNGFYTFSDDPASAEGISETISVCQMFARQDHAAFKLIMKPNHVCFINDMLLHACLTNVQIDPA